MDAKEFPKCSSACTLHVVLELLEELKNFVSWKPKVLLSLFFNLLIYYFAPEVNWKFYLDGNQGRWK